MASKGQLPEKVWAWLPCYRQVTTPVTLNQDRGAPHPVPELNMVAAKTPNLRRQKGGSQTKG